MKKLIAALLLFGFGSPSYGASQSITLAALGPSSARQIDTDHFEPGVGIICTVASGSTLTYSVQVTGDPVPPLSGLTHWNDHDIITNKTSSMNDSIAYPVTAVRINTTSYGNGSVTCAFVQSGNVQQFQWFQKGSDNP